MMINEMKCLSVVAYYKFTVQMVSCLKCGLLIAVTAKLKSADDVHRSLSQILYLNPNFKK